MSITNQVCEAAHSFVELQRWAWSPSENRGSHHCINLNGIDLIPKLSVRVITVGTAGAIATFAAYKLGILGAALAAGAACGFGAAIVVGIAGGAAMLYVSKINLPLSL